MTEEPTVVILAFDGWRRNAPGFADDGFESYDPKTARTPTTDELMREAGLWTRQEGPCRDCGKVYADYTVPHGLWHEVVPDDGLLCFSCFSQRWEESNGCLHCRSKRRTT